jgi:hypothetical protein
MMRSTLLLALVLVPVAAAADGQLGLPVVTPFGTQGGDELYEARGRFSGTARGVAYKVPYLITFRADAGDGVEVLLEPPHVFGGPGTRDTFLGPDFVFGRMKLVHASVGWSPSGRSILEPGGADIILPPATTLPPHEIIADFAAALRAGPIVPGHVGSAARVYLIGYSQSSAPVMSLLDSARATANGEPLIDFALPFTLSSSISPLAVAKKLPGTKIIALSSENEALFAVHKLYRDDLSSPDNYRSHEAAGTPHTRLDRAIPVLDRVQTPIDSSPELRARFREGVLWATTGQPPGPSVRMKATEKEDPVYGRVTGVKRDRNDNAIAVYIEVDESGLMTERPAPRRPALETGEATFKARQSDIPPSNLAGQVLAPKSIGDEGFFPDFPQYRAAFARAVEAQLAAGLILPEDAARHLSNVDLSTTDTYTESFLAYRFF